MDLDRFDVFVGLDVGIEHHHATAFNSVGKRVHDKALPEDESALREVFTKLVGHGSVLVVVDQPATIGALPVTVARAMGIEVAYLPGLAMRRIADLHPGNAKADARDAYIIAEAGRTMPHALRRVGGDDDLAGEVNRVSNRIRGLLTQIHPALERAIGANIGHPAVLALLAKFGGPTGLAAAGRRRLAAAGVGFGDHLIEFVECTGPRVAFLDLHPACDHLYCDRWGQFSHGVGGLYRPVRVDDEAFDLVIELRQLPFEVDRALDHHRGAASRDPQQGGDLQCREL